MPRDSGEEKETDGVVDVDARVDNVRAGALAGALVINIRSGALGAVRDAA